MATKIVTKNSSTASAVPTASDLVQGELAVNVADKKLFTEDNSGAIIELADGVKLAGIEASADVTDTANVTAAGAVMDSELTSEASVKALNQGVATTDSPDFAALNVNGTATMDGLTVDGTSDLNGTITVGTTYTTDITGNDVSFFRDNGTSYIRQRGGQALALTTNDGSDRQRIKIDANGDISFYEDTGTTPKLFWDASAESLGIGDMPATPKDTALNLRSNSDAHAITIYEPVGTNENWQLGVDGDGDLGFYNSGSTTASVTFDDSGNVGIGTSSPASTLEIANNDKTNGATLSITNTYNSGGYNAGDVVGTINFRTDDTSTTQPIRGQIKLFDDAASASTYSYANAMSFSTGYFDTLNERMRIDSSGNVGIGTSSPNAPLSVSKAGAQIVGEFINPTAQQTARIYATCGTQTGQIQQKGNTHASDPNTLSLVTTSGDISLTPSGVDRLRVTAAGNVGIGTSSPAKTLSVAGNLQVDSGAANSDVSFVADDGYDVYLGFGTAADRYASHIRKDLGPTKQLTISAETTLSLKTNAAERMRIDSSGNLLVGTTDTGNSGSYFKSSASSLMQLNIGSTTTTTQNVAVFRNPNGAVGTISTSGSSTSYNTSSDQRLKENIADADDAGSKIDSIQVRKYDWKADGSHQDYGMIAQELQAVAPEAVSGDADSEEMMGVDYSKLVPMLIKEIQSLRNRVAQLEE